jgi:hypothetical protein
MYESNYFFLKDDHQRLKERGAKNYPLALMLFSHQPLKALLQIRKVFSTGPDLQDLGSLLPIVVCGSLHWMSRGKTSSSTHKAKVTISRRQCLNILAMETQSLHRRIKKK